jgi:hypothetical protein
METLEPEPNMIRIATLAATTAALLALASPAAAKDAIRVSTAGKSAAQVNAEVAKAARTVCHRESRYTVSGLGGQIACERAVIAEALKSPAYIRVASR